MVKCPKCEAEIDTLNFSTNRDGYVQLNNTQEIEFIDDMNIEFSEVVFSCPECSEELFRDTDEAEEFLQKTETQTKI